MGSRHPASFAKRQREAAKRAKRQEKAEKKAQRRAEKSELPDSEPGLDSPETAPGEGETAEAAVEVASGPTTGS